MMRPLADIEKEVILLRLRSYNYNLTHTARSLDIGLRTLQRKLKLYGHTAVKAKDLTYSGLERLVAEVLHER